MRPLVLVARLALLVVLVLASAPTWARERVCVLGRDEVVVPMGRCGMPCCSDASRAIAPPEERSCCPAGRRRLAAGTSCSLATRACRCEIRLVSGPTQPPVVVPASVAADEPIVLPSFRRAYFGDPLLEWEPGARHVDSGPTRKPLRGPYRSRAPHGSILSWAPAGSNFRRTT